MQAQAISSEFARAKAASVYAFMISGSSADNRMNIDLWDWIPGVGVLAIWRYFEKTGSRDALRYLTGWTARNLGKSCVHRTVNSTAPFALLPALHSVAPDDSYTESVRATAQWLMDQAPRTREGAFEHTVTEPAAFPEQVWADTVYMAVLFLAQAAGMLGSAAYAQEALRQLELHLRLLQDDATGVLFHGWNCGERHHMSGARWTRANAWVALGFPCIIQSVAGLADIPAGLSERYVRLMTALLDYQNERGLWHTVLDRPDFYEETSGSAGIAAGIIRAIECGLLDGKHREAADRTAMAIIGRIDEAGRVIGVSGGTPVKESLEDYNLIPFKDTLYGQGLALMLLSEYA
ncbi:glycoside hydrolase family 88 protein [Paenibacillus doosanensis]|uniref:glycoside hydrolase family 88/105 protein n=1 Tax=Paenibacillus TaxID=44249 RepID=UPI00201D371E|nr:MULTISPECIES: glycoside hydrolase family 88 protein [Paenibacillus]MCS7464704.1 glycoside hydrolase family 88 protein [Paenibacillus doosanensis]